MTIPDYLTTDDSEKENKISNLKPPEVKQKGSFIPFLRNGSPNRKSFEKLMERQSSYLSVTTATSTSTQPSLGDMVLERQSDHSKIIEEEDFENLSQNLAIKSSPPKTPTTVAADESFFSSDDEEATKENSFLDRLETALDDNKPEVYADDDSDEGQEDVMFQHKVNSSNASQNCPVSDLESSPSSPSDFRETLNIYAILHKNEEDEEARLAVAPLIAELKAPYPSEDSTASEYSDVAIENTTAKGFDIPDGADESDSESGVPKKKIIRDSRVKSLKMIFVACVFATLFGITMPFFLETSGSSRAAIATASPSVSMAPSSTPSMSQAPSEAPSSNPSLHPTISRVPTISPSGHPTGSLYPSMVPSISRAPSDEPSFVPTESMEPSGSPSEVPSDSPSSTPSESPSIHPTVSMSPSDSPSSNPTPSPSARPTQSPTISFQPTRSPSRSPTRRPSESPTDAPSRPPITPPPPVNPADAFKIRLYWDPAYFWQEEKVERFWCMECVKCAEYGGLDAPDHGCNSYGTGDERRCQAGDSLWIRDCRGRGNRFNIQGNQGDGFMVRIATTDLCIEKIEHDHPHLYIQKCDLESPFQRFMPWNDNHKFEIRSRIVRNDCVSQAHHPKSGELIALHNCVLAERDETLFWEQY